MHLLRVCRHPQYQADVPWLIALWAVRSLVSANGMKHDARVLQGLFRGAVVSALLPARQERLGVYIEG